MANTTYAGEKTSERLVKYPEEIVRTARHPADPEAPLEHANPKPRTADEFVDQMCREGDWQDDDERSNENYFL